MSNISEYHFTATGNYSESIFPIKAKNSRRQNHRIKKKKIDRKTDFYNTKRLTKQEQLAVKKLSLLTNNIRNLKTANKIYSEFLNQSFAEKQQVLLDINKSDLYKNYASTKNYIFLLLEVARKFPFNERGIEITSTSVCDCLTMYYREYDIELADNWLEYLNKGFKDAFASYAKKHELLGDSKIGHVFDSIIGNIDEILLETSSSPKAKIVTSIREENTQKTPSIQEDITNLKDTTLVSQSKKRKHDDISGDINIKRFKRSKIYYMASPSPENIILEKTEKIFENFNQQNIGKQRNFLLNIKKNNFDVYHYASQKQLYLLLELARNNFHKVDLQATNKDDISKLVTSCLIKIFNDVGINLPKKPQVITVIESAFNYINTLPAENNTIDDYIDEAIFSIPKVLSEYVYLTSSPPSSAKVPRSL